MSQYELAGVSLGDRFWKLGDRKHIWVVDALIPAADRRNAFVVLISEDECASEEVELSHLKDSEQYMQIA